MSEPRFFDLLAAAKRYRAGGPGPKATLMALVEHMGETEDGWACWPKMASLAFETEQSVGTVRRHVATFEAAGLIERRARGKEGGGRGSNLFVLDVQVLLFGPNRASCAGDQSAHPSEQSAHDEREQSAHSAEVVPLIGTPTEPPRTTNARASRPTFEDFYREYPLHVGPGAARKAWETAVKKASPEEIVAGAIRYRQDPNRDPSYTKHPGPWLNAERWKDDPLPPRSNGRASVGARTVANALAMEQRRSLGPPPAALNGWNRERELMP